MGRKGKETSSADLLDRRARPFHPRDARDTSELLDMCVEALQDIRHATREAALAALAGALEGHPPLAELDSRCYNLFALCGICVREGSAKEARLALRAVGLLALTLRAGAPAVLAESFPALRRALLRRGDAQTVAAALDCLAAVTVAGARGKDDVERSLRAVWDAVILPATSRPPKPSRGAGASAAEEATCPKVLAAAVSTWAFFLTTVTAVADAPRKADGAAWNAAVASLAGLLDHDDRAVRMAAGEALAVCVELNRTQHAPRKDMDALAAKVSELASEPAGKGVNNTMLPEQKDLFRKIGAFLDHGERLMESLPTSVEGCVALKVSTWTKLVQLNFLTRFLGNGFAKHVQSNELFKEAFSYGADEGKVLYIANKKGSSKTEKDLKAVKRNTWDWTILCDYPYRARYHPETLLQIGWQALN